MSQGVRVARKGHPDGVPRKRDDRIRGIFSLPLPTHPRRAGAVLSDLCHGSRRRHESRHHVHEWLCEMVRALNSMYEGTEFRGTFEGCERQPNLAQRLTLSRLRDSILELGKPPSDLNGQGALAELRAKIGYTGEPVSLAAFNGGLVSLPDAGSRPASFESILGDGAESFREALFSKLCDTDKVREKKGECPLKAPYFDPQLQTNKRLYLSFVRRLLDANLIELRQSCREQVGLFSVWKKGGKQRMIVDARLSNLWFDAPEKVRLATGSSFSKIEVDAGPPIEVAGVDIADAFYRIELPTELRDLFALKGIRARDLNIAETVEGRVGLSTLIFPCFKVVPMGWTQALWICQHCHERVVEGIDGLGGHNRLADKTPAPRDQALLHTEYVDNFVALSQAQGEAFSQAVAVEGALNKRGLPTHTVESGTGGETLGWAFSAEKPEVMVTPRRLWRLRLAVLEVLRDGYLSGRTLECIIGHYTFAGLLRREFLSVFQASYVFVRKHYQEKVAIWPEVRRELTWACTLLPLVRKDLGAQWSKDVYATDASHWGRGIVKGERTIHDVQSVGSLCDRWRFTWDEELAIISPRQVGPGEPIDAETLETARRGTQVGTFDEVPADFIGGPWEKIEGGPWDRDEAIPVLEGRAIVWAVQHIVRSQTGLGKRHLILSDSMSAVLALTKGRSGSGGMMRVCRQVAALAFASGIDLHYRWLASEINPADGPSRGRPLNFSFEDGLGELLSNVAARNSSQSWRVSASRYYAQSGANRGWPQPHRPAEPEGPAAEEEARREGSGEKGNLQEGAAATQVGQGALTFLEERSVGLQRRKSYQAAWSLFKKWCLSEGLEWSETEGLDAAAAAHMDYLFFEGAGPAEASTFVAAVRFHSGLISRVGDMKKTSRALRGLQKLDPRWDGCPCLLLSCVSLPNGW